MPLSFENRRLSLSPNGRPPVSLLGKTMIRLQNDYTGGVHPRVLSSLVRASKEEYAGYGTDEKTESVRKAVLKACALSSGAVFFVKSGTQANTAAVSFLLKPTDSVLCAATGHIATQETGALAGVGHVVQILTDSASKVDAKALRAYCRAYETDASPSHLTKPAVLYLSFPNELGQTYTLEELRALSRVCVEHGLYLYIDGARLFYGLDAETSVTLADMARLADVFTIGATKCGALSAEAVVFRDKDLAHRFDAHLRRAGALSARGWVCAVQIEALLKNRLAWRLARTANSKSEKLAEVFSKAGIAFISQSKTNMQFVRLYPRHVKALRRICEFQIQRRFEDDSVQARFCTTWATPPGIITRIAHALKETCCD